MNRADWAALDRGAASTYAPILGVKGLINCLLDLNGRLEKLEDVCGVILTDYNGFKDDLLDEFQLEIFKVEKRLNDLENRGDN